MLETISLLTAAVGEAGLIFLVLYAMYQLSNLEYAVVPVATICKNLNQTVLPELTVHVLMIMFLLAGRHWFIFALNLPLVFWHMRRRFWKPAEDANVYEMTRMCKRAQIKIYLKELAYKFAFHMSFFCLYAFCFLAAIAN